MSSSSIQEAGTRWFPLEEKEKAAPNLMRPQRRDSSDAALLNPRLLRGKIANKWDLEALTAESLHDAQNPNDQNQQAE
jgi:hypothetical protein